MSVAPAIEKSAVIQGDFRWELRRRWVVDGDDVVFVMLNPSTADEKIDDPTVRRCIDFATERGYGGLIVVNLYPYRSPSPRELARWLKAAGVAEFRAIALNEHHVARACFGRDAVLAWGAVPASYDRQVDNVARLVRRSAKHVYHLGDRTKSGHPRHPLYLPKTADWNRA